MTRTQIQLPDELYQRAKAFASERELSLAEITRRGLEMFLARFPANQATSVHWQMPIVSGKAVNVPLEQLREFSRDEEADRSRVEK
jgi:predicted transcriptional regulator